uniref:Uncharacterized protein n=1 Tax=Bionectria ochroleuca TaxID=29856 RepID=A0A8H7KFX5_BIOOC
MYHQILPAQTAAGDPEAVVGAPVACSLWLNFHFFFLRPSASTAPAFALVAFGGGGGGSGVVAPTFWPAVTGDPLSRGSEDLPSFSPQNDRHQIETLTSRTIQTSQSRGSPQRGERGLRCESETHECQYRGWSG